MAAAAQAYAQKLERKEQMLKQLAACRESSPVQSVRLSHLFLQVVFSLTRLCLEGFLLNFLEVSGLLQPGPVPPTPGGGFPLPADIIHSITI